MSSPIAGLEPVLVWKHFARLSQIPRCSKHEAAAAEFVVTTATKLGLTARQDAVGNVVVSKPASSGRDRVPSICLQGHLDMVCEKAPSVTHDFAKQPIELARRDNTLCANGTTLGADNGIAVATNLAIMEDPSLEHGPLEFLFTVDEETGMTGAHNLQPGFITSRTLLNLDSEEEGALYVGCAGGRDTLGTWRIDHEPAPASFSPLDITVGGLLGGHSGLEIDKRRGNALKLVASLLHDLTDAGARLALIAGGNKRNAIPRDARALVFVPDVVAAERIVARCDQALRKELATVEPALRIVATRGSSRDQHVMAIATQTEILQALAALPPGVIKMSADRPPLVQTSPNLAVITTSANTVSLETSQRSSVASELDDIVRTVSAILERAGAHVEHTDGYPGWQPNMHSPVLKTAINTYEALFAKTPAVKAVHAGLECGIIGEKYPGIDMVSFGPTLEGVHSPDERIYTDSVPRFWTFLLGILKTLPATI